MRIRRSWLTRFAALVALAAVGLTPAGCGSSFKLPTEQTANRTPPADKQYQMIATWTGLTGVTDVLLIPGPQLYLAFKGGPGHTGHVYEFSTTLPSPLALDRFQGLLHPAALAGNASSIFVLDQGDTLAARSATPDSNNYELDCGPLRGHFRLITDLSKYWYVREYDIKGRTMKGQFSDTTFAWVNGVAADADGKVYVSGIIRHCFVDHFDPRLRTLDSEYRIRRYERGSGDRYVVGGWQTDTTFEIVEGTGIGSTLDPRGMAWSAAKTGSALYFADFGNNEAQKCDVRRDHPNSFKLDICETDNLALVQPTDVDVDAEGHVYVVDAGNRRVLRYTANGDTCSQRVDVEVNTLNLHLTGPTAAASLDFNGTNYVYVVDPPVNQVVVFRRRT